MVALRLGSPAAIINLFHARDNQKSHFNTTNAKTGPNNSVKKDRQKG